MALTKIVATVGPSSKTVGDLSALIKAGASVFRFNLKHNVHVWHKECLDNLREASKKTGKPVAVLFDLQGPNIRVGTIQAGEKKLKKGEKVNFVKNQEKDQDIPVSDSFFAAKTLKGKKIFVDDGKLKFEILKRVKNKVSAKVLRGGIIKSNKSINIPDVEISLPSLLDKDIKDLSFAAKEGVDFIALSFVRDKEDLDFLKKHLKKIKFNPQIIAKIENRQALNNFEEIIEFSDGIMVARGDLGIEIPLEEVPFYQKKMIRRCAELGKPVITATHMLESMTGSVVPSRAEVSDVANAILDYTDAIMLSQETSIGKYPKEAVEAMEKIATFWEKKRPPIPQFKHRLKHQTAAICHSAYKLWMSPFCKKEKVKAFVVMTETGMTARMLSRLKPDLPIIALTNKEKVRNQLCLSYGVIPLILDYGKSMHKQKNAPDIKIILDRIKESSYVKKRDKIIAIYGEDWGTPGKTSIMRIQEIS